MHLKKLMNHFPIKYFCFIIFTTFKNTSNVFLILRPKNKSWDENIHKISPQFKCNLFYIVDYLSIYIFYGYKDSIPFKLVYFPEQHDG